MGIERRLREIEKRVNEDSLRVRPIVHTIICPTDLQIPDELVDELVSEAIERIPIPEDRWFGCGITIDLRYSADEGVLQAWSGTGGQGRRLVAVRKVEQEGDKRAYPS